MSSKCAIYNPKKSPIKKYQMIGSQLGTYRNELSQNNFSNTTNQKQYVLHNGFQMGYQSIGINFHWSQESYPIYQHFYPWEPSDWEFPSHESESFNGGQIEEKGELLSEDYF